MWSMLRMPWRLLSRSSGNLAGTPPDTAPRAVQLLGAEGLADARCRAEHVLSSARRCSCCTRLLAHVFDRLGSTLFLDDDPVALSQAFEDVDRDAFSARVLAACIVLSGRERVIPAVEGGA